MVPEKGKPDSFKKWVLNNLWVEVCGRGHVTIAKYEERAWHGGEVEQFPHIQTLLCNVCVVEADRVYRLIGWDAAAQGYDVMEAQIYDSRELDAE